MELQHNIGWDMLSWLNCFVFLLAAFRTGDLALYIFCLPQLGAYFFTFNHINYARWIVRYTDNLLKLEETHPEVYNEFRSVYFAIRRTDKSFSKVPIDLTLEQTINADAASQRRRGIVSLTNSISARQRWAESNFIRTTIVSHLPYRPKQCRP